ncbi:hypothetical protein VTO42DRAFT_7769 [Malbranchea cinnamomea]
MDPKQPLILLPTCPHSNSSCASQRRELALSHCLLLRGDQNRIWILESRETKVEIYETSSRTYPLVTVVDVQGPIEYGD